VEVQVNPWASSGVNYYYAAADLIYSPRAHSNLYLSAGLKHTEHEDIDGHSKTWRGELGYTYQQYFAAMRYSNARLSALSNELGRYDPSTYHTWEIEISRRLNKDLWLGISYLFETNDSRSFTLSLLGELESHYAREHQMVIWSAKWKPHWLH
jgi:predicted porin